MANLYGPRIVTDGLVLCLDAGNSKSYPGSGTTWYDLSGNNFHGTLTNGPTYSSSNKGSIVFDGTNDYINCDHNTTFNITTQDFYIDLWIMFHALLTNDASYFSIFQKGRTGNSTFQYGLLLARLASASLNNHIALYLSSTGNTNIAYSSNYNSWNLNQWYNIGVSKVGTTANFYINGNLINTVSVINTLYSSTDPLVIGANSAGGQSLNGKISIAKFYVGENMSLSEVSQNYNATKGRYGL